MPYLFEDRCYGEGENNDFGVSSLERGRKGGPEKITPTDSLSVEGLGRG